MTKKARLERKVRRLLSLSELNCYSHPSGCFGTYIKLSDKVGIKIVDSVRATTRDRFFYLIYTRIEREVRMMREVRRYFGLVPRSHGIVIVRDLDNRYRIGILMQHLGDTTLWELIREKGEDGGYKIEEKVQKSLRKRKFCHADLHSKNIMYFRRQFWPIDYSDVFRILNQ